MLNDGRFSPADRSQRNRLLLLALLSLTVYPLLMTVRHLDDNALTSWRWAAAAADTGDLFLLHALVIGGALILSKCSFPQRSPAVFLLLVSIAAAPLFWSLPETVIDASRYFTQAKHLSVYGMGYFLREWGESIDAWTDLPLVPFLYGLLFKVFGELRLPVQIFNTLLFAASVQITYAAGKTLWGRETGFYAGLFLLAIPYLQIQVPLMLTDIATMFFLTLAVFCTFTYLRRGGGFLLTAAVLSTLPALLAKYSSWPALCLALPTAMVAVLFDAADKRAVLSRGGSLFFLLTAVFAPVVLWKFDIFSRQFDLLTAYQWSGLRRWGESCFSTFFFQVHPFVTLLALSSACEAARRRDALWLLPAGLLALMIAMQVRRARYLIVVFPMLSLTAAYGLQALRDERLKRFAAYCVVSYSLVISIFLYRPFLQQISLANLQQAGVLLNTLGRESVEVFTPAPGGSRINPSVSVPLLDLYTSARISYRPEESGLIGHDPARTSPFRFTWRYRNPAYYAEPSDGPQDTPAVVVIAGEAGASLPGGLEAGARGYSRYRLEGAAGVFRYRTMVSLYVPPPD